uniref:Protein E6 n=1 Tax=human papillomavirus 86 TaxID=171370 RepID=A0A1P8NVV8_9PAPI|nr:E6 protein [human papillomavirus 86]APX52889.1 E6 protein [human papillomavirus 86]
MPRGCHTPTNIFVLCQEYEVEFDNLRLLCIFCKNELTEGELLSFALKELLLVWKHGFPHGVCLKCICREAKVRELRHWEHSSYGSTVEQDTGVSLAHLNIRCHACFKPLCWPEKLHMVELNLHFHKIAGQWTGKCSNCRATCMARRRP